MSATPRDVAAAQIDLERDGFMRTLIRELAGTLQDVVGTDEAAGFISVVGQRMGDQINASYRQALQIDRLSPAQVADVLVDLKRRIQGDFYVLEARPDRIVFGNRRCPFGDRVVGRPSMCMMTSNVFGVIASRNLGSAKVALEATIAEGAPECRVVVYIGPSPDADRAQGREYVGPA